MKHGEKLAARSYWREADARKVVGEWRRSGRSLRQFASERGVSRQRLGRWVARLAAESEMGIAFHPVRVVGASAAIDQKPIEIVLVGGTVVRVPSGVDEAELVRVLSVLGR